MNKKAVVGLGVVALVLGGFVACGGGEAPKKAEEAPEAKAKKGKKAKAEPKVEAPTEPVPSLVVVQAQFGTVGGKPRPLPAKMLFLRYKDGEWFRDSVEDPEANVFHKAIPWRDGVLTIGAEVAPKPATLKHWKKESGEWKATTLWTRAWDGARFNRLRDVELGDVTGDGREDIVIATHDRGVVAVGTEGGENGWTFTEMDEAADTFVHEIEIGDVDGDGTTEFYATPSDRNKASGESQPGMVVRYDHQSDGTFERSVVVQFEESHAKEILVTDVDADGTDELYVVREGHTVKEGGKKKLVDPVRVVQFGKSASGAWEEKSVTEIDDHQTRFLLAGDVDHDGQTELIAAGYKSGLWLLEPKAEGGFDTTLIDADSSGFEHATHVADLDGDGKLEIYVAADDQKQFRRYTWNGKRFDRKVVGPIGPSENSFITWNIQDGVF